MGSLASALRRANLRFLRSGLRFAALSRSLREAAATPTATEVSRLRTAQHEAEMQWRIDRKNVHIAFSNFVGAFYRMMAEPERRQRNVRSLNVLMAQHHTLASHISATIPLLADADSLPPDVTRVLGEIESRLAGETETALAEPEPLSTGDARLSYPLRQMLSAAALIDELTEVVTAAPEDQRRNTSRSELEASTAKA